MPVKLVEFLPKGQMVFIDRIVRKNLIWLKVYRRLRIARIVYVAEIFRARSQ